MKNKTNRTLRKILSIALCLALVMSYVPMVSITASAAEGTPVAEVGEVEYTNFATAVANWTDNTTLTLLADVTDLAEQIELSGNGLVLDLNGKKLEATVDHAIKISAGELTIRDSAGAGSFTTTQSRGLWVFGGNVNFESGTLESVTISKGTFNMTGGTIQAEAFTGIYVSGEGTANISGGEINVTDDNRMGVYNGFGILNLSGNVVITSTYGYAFQNSDASVLTTISGDVALNGSTGELYLGKAIFLNTQPTGDTTWRVSINTGYNSGIENGVFAIPGDGVTLDPAKFTSLMDGYEVKLNKKNELVLCNHSSATTAVSNGNGTHNTTCDCNETTIESNIACSGGVATATHLAVCAYCGGTYGELDANVNYDIIATAMTAAELKDAVAAWLADGNTDISILLAAYADEEMFTAVKTALAESTLTDGSINLTIAGVKTIPDEALSDYPISIGGNKLKTLTLTDADTTGENEPFARCTYLESVSLPNATTIGAWAFNECSNLTSVYCPKVNVIGGYAFRKCAKLTTFDFTNITTIGNGAFSGCDFNTIVLPEATSIGGSAFVDNPNLISFSAPKATSFGWYPWGAETIETSKLESLELTAAGEFTIENNFSAYTPFEQINLVLNIDKKDQVTQKDDGTATWTYPYTNSSTGTETKTFKSITLTCVDGTTNHTYQYTDVSNGTHKAECTVEGCGFYKYEAHTPDAEGYTVNDDSTHSFTCSVCNATVTEDHTVPYTLEFQWGEPYETDDGKECYVEGNLLCQDCGESVAYDYGYGKLTSSTEGTDCMNPEKEMYEITLTLNDTEYTDIHTVIIPSDNHTGEFVDGFCTDCGGYQNPDVNPGEDPEWEYDDIYLVENAGQLFWIANYVNNVSNEINVLLTTDITIPEGKEWTPIMNFYGTFDGGYYTVSGLDASGDEFVGMFGGGSYAYGTIKNLHITNSRFEGTSYVGALAGYHAGNIYNCYVDSSVTVTGDSSTGLLVGHNAGAVQNCYAYGSSCVGYYDGNYSTVENCYYLSETETEDGGKTAEQFASGEVAYLLQQGNTEQIWGQMSNTEGSLPIITDNELYKVVTVGETGNYSVANIGDTNGDGTVDVNDYQVLVNKALADDHEQIETASYDDIVKYDLDGDGYLDVIDAYLMHLFINGFTTVDVYAVGDYDLNGKAFEEADIKAIKHAIENPEKLATYKKYASDINGDGKLDENDLTALTAKYGEVTGTACADNVKVYYRWGNKYSTCTATAICTLCGEKVATETVNTTSETLAELTCTQDGKVKYTATFQNELLGTKSIEIVLKTEGHKYNDNGFCLTCDVYQPAELNESGYYEIGNAGQLFWFAQQVNVEGNKEIKGALTADIHLENKPWTPIGAMGEENSFRGVFDGQNYTIRGLNVEGSENGVGFFGEVRTGTVKNFTIYGEVVVNAEVDYVGGVIGSICGLDSENDLERNGAIIQNITSYVNVTANAHGIGMIGGFVGYADHQSLIEKCSWYGTFNAGEYRVDSGAGGFIGKIQENTGEVTIRNCAAYGTIKTNYAKNSYNNYATIYMGGFLSFSNTNAQTTLENCLFAGKFERGENLTDEARLGAFGTLRSVNAIKNCYYLGDDGLEAVHSDSDLKPGDNIEIISVTEDDLRNNTVATQLGEYWTQGEHYPVIKK